MNLEGIIPVWKEAGFTSHDVVAKSRKILQTSKIGHSGTLDPLVTGVLPLCIGRATRLIEYLQEMPKEYEAVMLIGVSTDTQDLSGTIIDSVTKVDLSDEIIRRTVATFQGNIQQMPPMYSAVQVNGKRLYELAREGIEVSRPSRTVCLHEIHVTSIQEVEPYIEVSFRVVCSKGTYIRTLCVDIGQSLGYPAVMKSLIRTSTGELRETQCVTLKQMEYLKDNNQLSSCMLPMDHAVKHLPMLTVTQEQTTHLFHGKIISMTTFPEVESHSEYRICRAYTSGQHFIGIVEWDPLHHSVRAVKLFHS